MDEMVVVEGEVGMELECVSFMDASLWNSLKGDAARRETGSGDIAESGIGFCIWPIFNSI